MTQKKQNLCLNIFLNVKYLKNVAGCVLFCHYSIEMNEHDDISWTLKIHEILDCNRNWSQLAFSEAYYIKNCNLIINHVLKASII